MCILNECTVIGVNTEIEFYCNYRSPSQTTNKSETYYQDLSLPLTNIVDSSTFYFVLTSDFNARNSSLWSEDKTVHADFHIDFYNADVNL